MLLLYSILKKRVLHQNQTKVRLIKNKSIWQIQNELGSDLNDNHSCADPESFLKRGRTLTMFFVCLFSLMSGGSLQITL